MLDRVMTAELGLRIGSKTVKAENGRTFSRLNPLTGEVATVAAAASKADADKAVDAASEALPPWSGLGPNGRRAVLSRIAHEIEGLGDEFVAAMRAETGSTEAWARFNVRLAAGMMREAAALTTMVTGETIPSDKPGCIAMSVRKPAGVVLGIAPWNAPVVLAARAIATPLACGNSVVLKASEICPRTHWLISEAFNRAEAPPGILSLVTNAPEDAAEVVGALIDHPAVRRINFTGSTSVGKIIAQRAAGNLKPVLLELGGKSPMLVLKDADIDEAVKAAAFGAFMNQGQICMSTERIIVVDDVYETFLAKFAGKSQTLFAGDPNDSTAPLGAVIDTRSADKVRSLLVDALAKGASLIAGGNGDGVLIPATVIAGVTPQMDIYREESFGPIVSIIRASDTDDAIRIANDTDYGLTASVFTTNIAEALDAAARIESGMCHINGPTVHDEAQMPFGGVKASGYGRFGGSAGMNEFTDLRWITVETRPGHFPI